MADDDQKPEKEQTPVPDDEKTEAPDWLFDNIAEASKLARRIYFAYISLALYTGIMIVSVSDRQLLLNENIMMPNQGIGVPLTGFYILASLVVPFLYIYYQLYVGRIGGLVAQLEAEYQPVPKRRLYPWMINIAADPEPGFIGQLQRGVVDITGFGLVVAVIIAAAGSIIRTEMSGLQAYMFVLYIGALAGLLMFILRERRRSGAAGLFIFSGLPRSLMTAVTVAGIVAACVVASWLLSFGPFRPHYDFSFQSLVSKPTLETKGVYWLYLREARLRRAQLLHTDLRHTDLTDANLWEAEGDSANFTACNFFRAHLDEGVFRGVMLDSAILDSATLNSGDFSYARARFVRMVGAQALGTNFTSADFTSSDFSGSDLTVAVFQNATLDNCEMSHCNLSRANLRAARMSNVRLDSAILDSADLTGVIDLTAEALAEALSYKGAILDSSLSQELTKLDSLQAPP
ncbi:MAG: pentapeptide repeat-containing protein [bacterium]